MKIEKRGYSNITVRKEGWTDGEVVTPDGVVMVYAQGDDTCDHFSRLDVVLDGRFHMRSFRGKRYTPRGLALKAKQFIKELIT